jgi:Amt family ammonium transporter
MKKGIILSLFLALMVIFGAGNLFAQETTGTSYYSPDATEVEYVNADDETVTVASQLDDFKSSFDMIWLIVAAALVFLMQAGFAMVESGLTRAKNAGNILMKNLMDFSVGALVYWAIGWAIMYGASYAGDDGFFGWFIAYSVEYDIPGIFRDWMFQVVFAATAATIVSGAMAERTQFVGYLVYSIFISGLIYPVVGSWTWGGQPVFFTYNLAELWPVLDAAGQHVFEMVDGEKVFAYQNGFTDFAGSTIVHSTGGWAALMGAIILGPRIGKYVTVNGKKESKAILGHSLPLAGLGVFILWFGWYGFNAGSTLSGTDLDIAHVAITTTVSAAAGAIAAMGTIWVLSGKPDPSMSLNGALAGLVGITAGTWVINPGGAIIVGLLSGILVVISVEVIDKVLKIDDPVGAVSVHGVVGAFGTLAVGLFADGTKDGVWGIFPAMFSETEGAMDAAIQQFISQGVGVLTVLVFVLAAAGILFALINAIGLLRVSPKEELMGLDITEHGAESYSGFQIFTNI